MSKSLLYAVNTASVVAQPNTDLNLGNTVRRYGNAVRLNGNVITLLEAGYYDVAVNVTAQPTAIGAISATVLENGTAVVGATVADTGGAIENNVPLTIPAAVVRVYCNGIKNLTVQLSAEATVVNTAVTVMKV